MRAVRKFALHEIFFFHVQESNFAFFSPLICSVTFAATEDSIATISQNLCYYQSWAAQVKPCLLALVSMFRGWEMR